MNCTATRILTGITGTASAVLHSGLAVAAGIPGALTPPAAQGNANTGLIDIVKGFFRDWLPVVGYAIIGIILVCVAWFLFVKYSEANSKKSTWGEFIVTGIIGSLIALIASLFVSMATGIF